MFNAEIVLHLVNKMLRPFSRSALFFTLSCNLFAENTEQNSDDDDDDKDDGILSSEVSENEPAFKYVH